MDKAEIRRSGWRWVIIALVIVAVVVGVVIGGWTISRSRTFQLFGEIVDRAETSERVVALTFDDGPTPVYTDSVLALLAEKGIKATFFVIGEDAEKHSRELSAIISAGHELGNHTYTHPDMTFASEADAAVEVGRTDAVIRVAGYSGDVHVRPPYGKKLIGLPLHLAKSGRITVTWDVEPESDDDVAADPQKIVAHVIERTRPGSIILLHVMYPSRETSRQALPGVIDGLKARGFRFVTVSSCWSDVPADDVALVR